MRQVRELLWRTVAVAVLVGVIAAAVMVFRDLARDGDAAGNAFRAALTRVAQRGDLDRPVAVRNLAPFPWDSVAVVYPYAERFAREDVGDDADEIPSLREDEAAIIFVRKRRLVGWTVLGQEFMDQTRLDSHSCLIADRPLPRARAYLLARRGRLSFSSASGNPLRRTASTCR